MELRHPQIFEDVIRIGEKVDIIDYKNCGEQSIAQSPMLLFMTMT